MARLLKDLIYALLSLGVICLTMLAVHLLFEKLSKQRIAKEAYIWGYPLVVMERSKQLFTKKGGTPLNRFKRFDNLVTPDFTEVVTPNVDTLYSMAWLDLEKKPVVLKVPDTKDRYYVVQFLDAYTNAFKNVGKRATGTKEGTYLIAGPSWQETAPVGMKVIKAPTNMVWLVTRVLLKGDEDLSAARDILGKITLEPLSGPFVPRFSKDPAGSPQDVDKAGIAFFDELSTALEANKPPSSQSELLEGYEEYGVGPGKRPSEEVQQKKIRNLLTKAASLGEKEIDEKVVTLGSEGKNGWSYNLKAGAYGDDYITRAAYTKIGLGANVPQESMYAITHTDSDEKALSGTKRYVIHFKKDQIPPVDAFWSLTIYDSKTRLLAANPINRYSISDRSPDLKYNTDGSLDIYVEHSEPVQKSNWLPAPAGKFYLALRMYMPRREILADEYEYPDVKRISSK